MSLKIRSVVAAMLLFGFVSSIGSAAEPLHTQKLQSAHALAGSTGLHVDSTLMEAAVLRAGALQSLQIDSAGNAPLVRFGLTESRLYSARWVPETTSLVIDLYDTIVVPDLQMMIIDGGKLIANVSTELHAAHPQFITRTVVKLTEQAGYAFDQDATRLSLSFTRDATPLPEAHSPLASIAKSAIKELVMRDDLRLASIRKQTTAKLLDAERHLEAGKVALLKAQFADVVPATDGSYSDNDALEADLAREGNNTSRLKLEYQLTLQRRSALLNRANDMASDFSDLASTQKALRNIQSQNVETIAQLEPILERITQQKDTNQRLSFRLEQNGMTNLAHTGDFAERATLDQLDSAFASLRHSAPSSIETEATFAALDIALETVAQAPVELPIQSDTKLAALSHEANSSPLTFSEPPAIRTRPAAQNFGMKAIEKPILMAQLRSTPAELRRAQDKGIIVLAQQQQTEGLSQAQGSPATQIEERDVNGGPRRYNVPRSSGARPQFSLYNPNVPADQDPLRDLVNIDFRDMDLTNVVALLAEKGQINVIGGTNVSGTVTANLKNIPLGRAFEIVLRMNGLGIVEEAGVYRITSYDEAIALQRETRMFTLKNAQADEVKLTIEEVLTSSVQGDLVSVSSNPSTNVIILAGPRELIDELEGVITELDVTEPVVPTVTMPIKLNYSEPLQLIPVVTGLLSDVGSVSADPRSRHIIVTDIPVNVQEVQALIRSIDLPVKQVSIDAMIVDAQLDDDAQTGIEWIMNSLSGEPDVTDHTFEFEDEDGTITTTETIEGNIVSKLGTSNSFLPQAVGSQLFFKVLTGDLDISAIIAAEVTSRNAELLANPTVVTIENKPAIINITQEFPYQELSSTSEGGNSTSTKFKEIGVILEVTPRVTHDNHIISSIDVKESTVVGFTSTEVPIEAKRQAQTTLRMQDGQTIFIGGMRQYEDRLTVRKAPILGDIPFLGFLFSSKRSEQTNTELMLFLTCNVLPEDNLPELTPYEKERFDKLGGTSQKVDGTREVVNSYIHPEEMRDPIYKWRRTK